jgi:hypothetical protein
MAPILKLSKHRIPERTCQDATHRKRGWGGMEAPLLLQYQTAPTHTRGQHNEGQPAGTKHTCSIMSQRSLYKSKHTHMVHSHTHTRKNAHTHTHAHTRTHTHTHAHTHIHTQTHLQHQVARVVVSMEEATHLCAVRVLERQQVFVCVRVCVSVCVCVCVHECCVCVCVP